MLRDLAADSAIAKLGTDVRRLRANILLADVPLVRAGWEGKPLRVGEALIGLYTLRQRYVVTTIDPDAGEQDARRAPPNPRSIWNSDRT